MLFEPLDFIARLAASGSRVRVSIWCATYGLFAPNAKNGHHVVSHPPTPPPPERGEQLGKSKPIAPMSWMQRLRWVFEIDLRFCQRCRAPLRVLAAITNPRVINAILTHCDARNDAARGHLHHHAAPCTDVDRRIRHGCYDFNAAAELARADIAVAGVRHLPGRQLAG